MNPTRILIIEDEEALASALASVCRRLHSETTLCYSGQSGLEKLGSQTFSLVILDIGLPDVSGLVVLEKIRALDAHLPVLIITAHGNLENAVAAKKLGAAAYLVKPLDVASVQDTIRELLAAPRAETPALAPPDQLALLVGAAPAMQQAFLQIAHACHTDAPALITGPTGTGKTLAARVVHANSARRDSPFVVLHCSAVPEQLLESELFGHEKNAFTGAVAARAGHIERATGGTLFLDEIGDISPAVQAKLLRFVEEHAFTRVGGREDLRVDLRLITATNKNLREEVRAGRFREDLYYRLHVLEIELPPLRNRREDLPALTSVLLGGIARDRHLELTPETTELFARYDWPGNVRELRNALEHAAAVCSGRLILPQHLPRDIRERLLQAGNGDGHFAAALEIWLRDKLRAGADYEQIHDELESTILKTLLAHFENKPTILARAMKMNRVTLRKKCRQFSAGQLATAESDSMPGTGERSDRA